MATSRNEQLDVSVLAYAVHVARSLDELSDELCNWVLGNPLELDQTTELVTVIESLSVAKDSVCLFIDAFDMLCGHSLDEWLLLAKESRDND